MEQALRTTHDGDPAWSVEIIDGLPARAPADAAHRHHHVLPRIVPCPQGNAVYCQGQNSSTTFVKVESVIRNGLSL